MEWGWGDEFSGVLIILRNEVLIIGVISIPLVFSARIPSVCLSV